MVWGMAWAEDGAKTRVKASSVRNRGRFMRTDGVKAALWY